MVRRMFELYATGRYSLHSLVPEARTIDLTNNRGRIITKSGIEKILQNTFYAGITRIKTTGETFQGVHEPLISAHLLQTYKMSVRGNPERRSPSIFIDIEGCLSVRCAPPP